MNVIELTFWLAKFPAAYGCYIPGHSGILWALANHAHDLWPIWTTNYSADIRSHMYCSLNIVKAHFLPVHAQFTV